MEIDRVLLAVLTKFRFFLVISSMEEYRTDEMGSVVRCKKVESQRTIDERKRLFGIHEYSRDEGVT